MRGWSIFLAALLCAGTARAEIELEPGKPLRLIGEAAGTPEGAPKRFVIDARLSEGDEPFQSRIEGWFASLEPIEAGSGEISGNCVQERCALSVSLQAGDFGLTGDLAGPGGATQGQAVLKPHWSDQAAPAATPASFTAFGEEAPGLGRLAARDAIGAHELSDLLAWVGQDLGFSNLDDEEPDDRERAGLGAWQAQTGRPPSGLLLVADLAALRADVEAARRAAGWTPLSGPGWSAGYPAAVLKPAGGADRRFLSADGRAELVLELEPALSEEAWDALVERETEDRPDDDNRSYTRVNDDFEFSVTRGGARHVHVWHNREGGLARMAYRYPADDETLSRLEPILVRSFRVGEDLRAD